MGELLQVEGVPQQAAPYAARRVSRGWSRSHACAVAVPYRLVLVWVTAVPSPQVAGSPKTNSPPCLDGRPPRRADPKHRDSLAHHPVRAYPSQDLDGGFGQEVGNAGCVVAGVQHDRDVRVTGPPPGGTDRAPI